MAESDSILQLGIEAARDGNREEARNLFRLLTRQDSRNAQAWLWLAGVAENREERQAALERVVELEPTNEMAVKGLQALGVRPTVRLNNDPAPVVPPPQPVDLTSAYTSPSQPDFEPVAVPTADDRAAANRARFDVDDDDPFAALDSLSEAMETSPGAVRRADEYDDLDNLSSVINDDADANTVPRRAARPSSTASFSSNSGRTSFEEDDTEPARRGLSPLLIGLIGLIVLALIGLLAWRLFLNRGDGTATVPDGGVGVLATAPPDSTDVLGGTDVVTGTGTGPITDTGTVGGTGPITDTGTVSGTGEVALPTPAEPTVAPPTSGGDLAGVQPAIVPANSPLESGGWLYDFNRPTYAAPIAGGLGSVQPQQGRFVVVLMFLANNTGTAQAVPADFFVLKDAQGRVYSASPDASNAYVQRGVNADLSQTDAIPPDGLTRSVALIFDVAPDARDLVFFARSKTDQGWLVLSSVQ